MTKSDRRKYNKKYYRKNQTALILSARQYRKKNKIKISKRRKETYRRHTRKILLRNKNYRARNSKKLLEQKRWYRLRKMGLSEAEIQKAKQALRNSNECSICKENKPGGMGGWSVDHDHITKKFRGILCNRCNSLIGFAKDSLIVLSLATKYLRRCL